MDTRHNDHMKTPSSLGSCSVMAFVTVTDPVRAKAFYGGTLGLRFVSDELPFALVFDAHGTMLRVAITKDLAPAPYTVLGWQVPDISAIVESLLKAGVKFEHYGFKTQDKRGIWTTPSGAQVAWFKDPDGNLLSVTQF
jgi:catechol 2,3-dioxygenase-like lactoylglutathione lyase family enzyme